MLERIANAFYTCDYLLEANASDDMISRFVGIVKWYLSGWHIAPKAVKKPLNPILGEVFTCSWDNLPDKNAAFYVSEQTSHHPPESSYFYLIPEKRIRADGVLVPKSKFLGNSSAAMMEGIASLILGEHNGETYTVTQPNIYCRGILFGKLRYELGDHMLIKCPANGLEADIEFKTKGFISGDYDYIEGTIKLNSKTIFTVSGKWNGVVTIHDSQSGEDTVLFDVEKTNKYTPRVRPIEDQLENESRKLWGLTLAALEKNDHETATKEKFQVEDRQRQEAKRRIEAHEELRLTYFSKSEDKADVPFVIKGDIDVMRDSPDVMISKLVHVLGFDPRCTHN